MSSSSYEAFLLNNLNLTFLCCPHYNTELGLLISKGGVTLKFKLHLVERDANLVVIVRLHLIWQFANLMSPAVSEPYVNANAL